MLAIIKIGFLNAFAHYLMIDRFYGKTISNCGSNDLYFNPLIYGGKKRSHILKQTYS